MVIIKETALTFGQAIEAVKIGKMIARSGWNGKNMFVFQRPKDEIQAEVVVNNIKSLPDSVKEYFRKVYKGDYTKSSDGNPFTIEFTSYLCMKAADGSIVNGWLASQTDMLATDWDIVE